MAVTGDVMRADSSPWLDRGVRLGLVVYGVVHLVIAVTALQLAWGDRSGTASQQGAFAQLSQNPLGDWVLALVALGLAALAVWQVIEAWVGHRSSDGGKRLAKRAGSAGKAVVYAVLAFSAARMLFSSRSKGSSADSVTADLMSAPGGQLLVGAVGAGIIAVGLYLAYKGISERFTKDLDGGATSGQRRHPIILLGKVGHVAKGASLAIIGTLFVLAAVQHKAKKSGGLDVALQELLQQPFGSVLVTLVAVGLACFGLYCFAWARHLDR